MDSRSPLQENAVSMKIEVVPLAAGKTAHIERFIQLHAHPLQDGRCFTGETLKLPLSFHLTGKTPAERLTEIPSIGAARARSAGGKNTLSNANHSCESSR